MIIVTGGVTARPEKFEALLQASLDHVHRSRTEDGCISHAVHIDCENPLRLFFYEHWRDVAALQAHFVHPGSVEFIEAARAMASSSEAVSIFDAQQISPE